VDADLIIFVTTATEKCDALAQAMPCSFSESSGRAVAGEIQFCNLAKQDFYADLSTAVHELIHVLVRLCMPA
jgi:hypothetical protein